MCALCLGFVLMGTRLFVLQVVERPDFQRIAAQQRQTVVEYPARRGAILDRDGNTLAVSVDMKTVSADPTLIDDPLRVARRLAPVLDMEPGAIEGVLMETDGSPRFAIIARQVDPKVAKRVEALELPGIFAYAEPKRVYPNGRLASHILGFVNLDGTVKEGIESQYDRLLEGTPGRMVLEQDPDGRPLPQADFSYRRPDPGRSLLLTIDKEIQYFTEMTLRDAVARYGALAGTAIVMRPQTGEILALANVPDFDPNTYRKSKADQRRNRALTDVYEPGSVFKIVTASAALAQRVVSPHTTFMVPDELQVADRVIHDSHFHATEEMSVRDIITDSSNVGTVKIGQALGGEQLDRYVRRFGFGKRTGLDFPGESRGIVLPLESWSGSSIANIPIGQGVAVTPLQMLSAFATIANRGVAVEPKLLHGAFDPGGTAVASSPPSRRRVIPVPVAGDMRKIMRSVVTQGTGLEAQIPGYDVAGKTGTAQKAEDGAYGDGRVASFGGFAPASHPAVAAIVVLDEPSPVYGGLSSAPTFKLIVQHALRELGVAPTTNAEQAAAAIEAGGPTDALGHD